MLALVLIAMFGHRARAEVTVTVSSEAPIADRLICPSQTNQISLARGPAGGALAAWVDDRDYDLSSEDVYAARIGANGVSLDPTGIMLGDGDSTLSPTAAFDDTTSTWLVAWRGWIGGVQGVYERRIDANGNTLDMFPVLVASVATVDQVTSAASPGQFLVAWEDGTQILARRVTASGTILDPSPIVLGTDSVVAHPRAIFDGTYYVVVWAATGVQGVRVTTAGAVVAPGPVSLTSSTYNNPNTRPSIVQGDSEFLLAWHEPSLKHMRLNASLAPIDTPKSYYAGQAEESMTFDGTRYMLADTQNGTTLLQTQYISTANEDLGHLEYTAPGLMGSETAAVFTGTQLVVAFTNNLVARGVRVALDGSFLNQTPALWSATLNDQTRADITVDPTDGYLAAWRDNRDDNDGYAIYAARLAPGGALDTSGIRLSGAPFRRSVALSVAHGRAAGAPFVVVWHEELQSSFRAARVDAAGNVLDPGGFALYVNSGLSLDDQGWFRKNLACTANSCLFAWVNLSGTSVQGIRFKLDGTILDSTPIAIGSGAFVRLAANDNTFLVTIYGSRGYLVPDSGPASSTVVQLPGASPWDLMWQGDHFVMAWYASSTEIKITRLDATAHEIGPRASVPVSLTTPYLLRVIQDGSDAIVVWWSESAIRAARYTSSGTLVDPSGIDLGPTTSPYLRVGDALSGVFPIIEEHRARYMPGVGTWDTMRWVSISGMTGGGGDDAGVTPADAAVTDSGMSSAPPDAGISDGGPDDSGNPGGCCQSSSRPDGALVVAVLAVVLRRPRRKRR